MGRLSSGNRINTPTDDAGGLAVAYKLDETQPHESCNPNSQNALSFLQVQDGALATVGKVLDRMGDAHHGSGYNKELRGYRKLLERVLELEVNSIKSAEKNSTESTCLQHRDASGIKNAGNTSTVGDLGASVAGFLEVPSMLMAMQFRYNKFSHTLFTSMVNRKTAFR